MKYHGSVEVAFVWREEGGVSLSVFHFVLHLQGKLLESGELRWEPKDPLRTLTTRPDKAGLVLGLVLGFDKTKRKSDRCDGGPSRRASEELQARGQSC